ncbi:MAG: glycoside hydrolase [Actinomycetota bacterium]|nr:glycoside hydrolase [Actinomycetota bacterium]
MRHAVLALVAVLCGAGALIGAGLLLAADRDISVSPAGFVNQPAPIDANNSPSVARNPTRSDNLVVSYRVDRPRFSAVLASSQDGGVTWEHRSLPLPAGKDRPFAPDVAFAPDGTLYVVYVNLEGNGNVPANLWLATSADGGRSLAQPTRVAGDLTFQPRLAVSPDGSVHVTWLQGDQVGLLRLSGAPARVVAASSRDGGRTFDAPVPVSDPQRERVGAASPVVDARGRVFVLYEDFKGDRRDFENLEGPPWDEPFALVVTRSEDGGRSFSVGNEFESEVVPTRRFLVFLPEFPSLAAGPCETLYAAWADGRNGDEDVFLRRSDDGGASWDPPVRVNDDALGGSTSQYLPRVAVSPDGRVDVLFYDRRGDPADVLTDAYLATSADRGETFRNVRVSAASFDSRIGPSAGPAFGTDLGSRLALASDGREAFAVWTDTRAGSEVTGRQDIAGATVGLPAPSGPWPWLAVAGSLLLGMLALAALRLQERPARQAVPAPVERVAP